MSRHLLAIYIFLTTFLAIEGVGNLPTTACEEPYTWTLPIKVFAS